MRIQHLRWKVIALVVFVAVCMLVFVQLFQMAGGRMPWYDPYEAKALVPEPLNLVPNADVRRRGVKVGRVTTIEPRGPNSEVSFEIEDKEQAPIYRDATVRVRTKTLVGESYLEVDPGTAQAGEMPTGAALPLAAAGEVVPLERILSTVDPETRRELRRNLRGLGGGLRGHSNDLNRLFGALRPTAADAGRLMEALEPQRVELAKLIEDTGTVMNAIGVRTQDLRTLVTAAKFSAEAAASRDERLRESLDELPGTLAQARTSVAKLAAFAPGATPVFRDLRVAAAELTPTIRDLRPAAADGRRLFAELEPFLAAANPLLAQLRPGATAARKVLPPLDAVLRQANPALAYLKPYAPELTSFFGNVPAALEPVDALGHYARVFAMFSDRAYTNYPAEVRNLIAAFTDSGLVSQFHNPRENPYPKPGTIGAEQDFDGNYPRLQPIGGG